MRQRSSAGIIRIREGRDATESEASLSWGIPPREAIKLPTLSYQPSAHLKAAYPPDGLSLYARWLFLGAKFSIAPARSARDVGEGMLILPGIMGVVYAHTGHRGG
jgi:hypothetical protein